MVLKGEKSRCHEESGDVQLESGHPTCFTTIKRMHGAWKLPSDTTTAEGESEIDICWHLPSDRLCIDVRESGVRESGVHESDDLRFHACASVL